MPGLLARSIRPKPNWPVPCAVWEHDQGRAKTPENQGFHGIPIRFLLLFFGFFWLISMISGPQTILFQVSCGHLLPWYIAYSWSWTWSTTNRMLSSHGTTLCAKACHSSRLLQMSMCLSGTLSSSGKRHGSDRFLLCLHYII